MDHRTSEEAAERTYFNKLSFAFASVYGPARTGSVGRWIDLMKKIIAEDEFEQRVLQAAEPRLKYAARLHRKREYFLDPVRTAILNQEREKLKKDSKS